MIRLFGRIIFSTVVALHLSACVGNRVIPGTYLTSVSVPDTCDSLIWKEGHGENSQTNYLIGPVSQITDCSAKIDGNNRVPVIKPKIGDKISIRMVDYGSTVIPNYRSVIVSPLTLTLRRIDPNEGQLSNEEMQFLTMLLAVARYGPIDGSKKEAYNAIYSELSDAKKLSLIWNKLPNFLRLAFIRKDATRGYWDLFVDSQLFCNLSSSIGDQNVITAYKRKSDMCSKPQYWVWNFNQNGSATPVAAALRQSSNADDPGFYHKQYYANVFDFLNVSLGVAGFGNATYPESNWSLLDWQNAGICQAKDGTELVFRRVKFKAERPFWATIVRTEDDVSSSEITHKLSISREQRSFTEVKKRVTALIKESDLVAFRLADIKDIEWGIANDRNGKGVAAIFRGELDRRCHIKVEGW